MDPSGADEPLLERDGEVSRLAEVLEMAGRGSGQVVVVEGPGGIGKSRLLALVEEVSSTGGFTVARCRGSNLEQDFPYGGARQLLEPPLAAVADTSSLFEGAAGGARAVLEEASPPEGSPGAVLHGLFWLTATLAERQPLALLCDDAHWLDGPTLRYLAYLAHRIGDLPAVLVLGTRPPEPGPEGELLGQIIAEHHGAVLAPRPLTDEAVTALVQRDLSADATPAFCHAVAEASGGNPFLVVELLRSVRANEVTPDDEGIASLTDLSAGSIVASRMGRLSPAALEVARGVAVLGSDAHLRHVAALSGLPVAETALLADELIRGEVLGADRPLAFVHPLVAAAIYNDLLPGERATRHRAAAQLLADDGAAADKVAAHLLATDATADPWVCELLVDAGRTSAASGAADAAIAFYRRALEEPPAAEARMSILLELGTSEALIVDPGAAEHLREALEGLRSIPEAAVPLTTAYAVSLVIEGKVEAAMAAFDEMETELDGDDPIALDLLAGSVVIGMTGCEAARLAAPRVARLRHHPEAATASSPLVRGVRSFAGALANEPAPDMAAMAGAALATEPLDDLSRWMWIHLPLSVLVFTDQVADAAAPIDQALAFARRLGAPVHTAVTLTIRAWLAQRTGNLDDVEADALDAIEPLRMHRHELVLPGPVGLLVDVARERGDLDRADRLLHEWGYAGEVGPSLFNLFLLRARGLLRLAQGRHADAVADLTLGQQRFADNNGITPGFHAWGAHIARALAAEPGTRPRALPVVRRAHELADTFGAPRARGVCLLARTELEGGDQVEPLERAVGLLDAAGDRLTQARASLALGQSLNAHGERDRAIAALSAALDLAERCGATPLAATARERLRAAGVTRRRSRVAGTDGLTPSERRVAGLAAAGQTNRQIAEDLFLSIKTVETHLAHTYQKLGIAGRPGLADALAAELSGTGQRYT